jgi:hypothetical protein
MIYSTTANIYHLGRMDNPFHQMQIDNPFQIEEFVPVSLQPTPQPTIDDVPDPWHVKYDKYDSDDGTGTIVQIEGRPITPKYNINENIHQLLVCQSPDNEVDPILSSTMLAYNKDDDSYNLEIYLQPKRPNSDYGIFYPYRSIDRHTNTVYFDTDCKIIEDDDVVIVSNGTLLFYKAKGSYVMDMMDTRRVRLEGPAIPDVVSRIGWVDTTSSLDDDINELGKKLVLDYETSEKDIEPCNICGVVGLVSKLQWLELLGLCTINTICEGLAEIVVQYEFYRTHVWKSGDPVILWIGKSTDKKETVIPGISKFNVEYLPMNARPRDWDVVIHNRLLGTYAQKRDRIEYTSVVINLNIMYNKS